MADICNDNRFEIIARAKKALLEGTNIETDEAEMKVIDNILFRCWQMGWLDRYDTADTPQTETQNSNKNSNVILVYDGVSEAVRCAMCSNPNKSDRGCDGACSYDEKLYERIMKAIEESIAYTPQTEAVVKPYKPTNREILDAIENSDCPWK